MIQKEIKVLTNCGNPGKLRFSRNGDGTVTCKTENGGLPEKKIFPKINGHVNCTNTACEWFDPNKIVLPND